MKMYGNATFINESDKVYYVVKVNGQCVSMKHSNKILAEQELLNLPEDQKAQAEIVPVTATGDRILLG